MEGGQGEVGRTSPEPHGRHNAGCLSSHIAQCPPPVALHAPSQRIHHRHRNGASLQACALITAQGPSTTKESHSQAPPHGRMGRAPMPGCICQQDERVAGGHLPREGLVHIEQPVKSRGDSRAFHEHMSEGLKLIRPTSSTASSTARCSRRAEMRRNVELEGTDHQLPVQHLPGHHTVSHLQSWIQQAAPHAGADKTRTLRSMQSRGSRGAHQDSPHWRIG